MDKTLIAIVIYIIPLLGWVYNHMEVKRLRQEIGGYRRERRYLLVLEALVDNPETYRDLSQQTNFLSKKYAELRIAEPENPILKLIETKIIDNNEKLKRFDR